MGHLCFAILAGLAAMPAGGDDPACTGCGKEAYGTSIVWEGSPSEAAAKAKAQEKLVFVLHVSGYFEDAAFT